VAQWLSGYGQVPLRRHPRDIPAGKFRECHGEVEDVNHETGMSWTSALNCDARLSTKQLAANKISSSSSSFIFYFVCQNHTKSRRNAYMPAAVNFHKNLLLDMMVESRGLVTRRLPRVSSRTCHGEVGLMEFGL